MKRIKKIIAPILAIILFSVMFFQPIDASAATAQVTASAIVAQGKKHVGVRYLYGGTSPKGFDCSGFTSYTFKQKGFTLPRTATEQYKKGKSVSKSTLKAGDLVFFKTTTKTNVSHVGIYIGNNQFIHSASSKGVSIASINDPYYWKSRYVGAKRIL